MEQQLFQQLQRLDVQVVGRFVHHQQVGGLGEQLGQQQPVALTAGQAGDRRTRAFGREQEILQVADDVLATAIDLDEVAALGDVLQRGAGVVQLAAVLVEVRDLQAGAQLHFALLRREFAQQDLQQGRLARAVGADDAHAIAAHDRRGHVVQQHATVVGLGDVLGLDDLLARRLRRRGLHPHVAGQLAALGALAAHRLQCGDAAFVARAAGLDALSDPDLFLRQQLVEARVLLRLGVQAFFAAAQVVVVVTRPTGQLAAVDFEDAGGQRAQEAAVVGDEDDAATKRLQEAFQPGDRLDVEVVGGLVQQQDVGVADQGLRQQHAALHATGERREVGLLRQLQPCQHLLHAQVQVPAIARLYQRLGFTHRLHVAVVECMVVARQQLAQVAQALGDHVKHGALRILRHFLSHARDHHAVLHADLAVVRLQLAGHQAHQGGFAHAVAADDADALAGFDGQVDVFEEKRPADAEVDPLELHQGHVCIVAGAPCRRPPVRRFRWPGCPVRRAGVPFPRATGGAGARRRSGGSRPAWTAPAAGPGWSGLHRPPPPS